MASSCAREGLDWEYWIEYQGKFLHSKGNQALEQAAQGRDGVTIPGGIHKTCRCGPWGHGLVLGEQQDSILEIFLNFNDSKTILKSYNIDYYYQCYEYTFS